MRRNSTITRRRLLAAAPAVLLPKSLSSQTAPARNPIDRAQIPQNPVARWNFHRLGSSKADGGQGYQEGATISTVPDDSGAGHPLSILGAPMVKQTPRFTLVGVNGKGGFCPGCRDGNGLDTLVYGALQSPAFPLALNAMSVLFCAQFGGVGNTASAALGRFGNIEAWVRQQNSQWPRNFLYWDFTDQKGSTQFNRTSAEYAGDSFNVGGRFCGPVAGALVNGYGGVDGTTMVMLNRMRASVTGLGWNATSNNVPQYIWHEMVMYNRALTVVELDLWNVYCNRTYGSPLTRLADTAINRRVVFIGDSITEGQGSSLCQTIPNRVAGTLANWGNVEYINYGVGSAQFSQHIANFAYYQKLYDPTLLKNIAVLHGGGNDIRTGGKNDTQIYGEVTTLVSNLKKAGYTVIVGMLIASTSFNAGQENIRKALNAKILANAAGADAVIDTTSLDVDFSANQGLHPDDNGYARWASLVTPVVGSKL
jgi:lysophospholipase L1-like esterase